MFLNKRAIANQAVQSGGSIPEYEWSNCQVAAIALPQEPVTPSEFSLPVIFIVGILLGKG